MKNCYWILLILLNVNNLDAQNIILKVENLNEQDASLSSLSGEKISFIDTLTINEQK